jgi:hypothetical protein
MSILFNVVSIPVILFRDSKGKATQGICRAGLLSKCVELSSFMTALKSGYVLPNALLIPYSSPNFYP